mmetsp:Transcript_12724/g.29259  ORF Transcript_12724/g.29259 Transcript_12724/m.29259 type:complete len:223 (+) Transcript_12724:945-1613(+)
MSPICSLYSAAATASAMVVLTSTSRVALRMVKRCTQRERYASPHICSGSRTSATPTCTNPRQTASTTKVEDTASTRRLPSTTPSHHSRPGRNQPEQALTAAAPSGCVVLRQRCVAHMTPSGAAPRGTITTISRYCHGWKHRVVPDHSSTGPWAVSTQRRRVRVTRVTVVNRVVDSATSAAACWPETHGASLRPEAARAVHFWYSPPASVTGSRDSRSRTGPA